MKKIIKFIVWTVVLLVLLIVALVATLPIWFGPVVKTVSNMAVPKVTKTGFNLAHLSLNPYTARFELGDMQLWNPAGYPQEFAVTVGTMNFDADTLSLPTDVVHIEEITIKDIFVSYVSGGENKVDNFTQIQYNVAGGKEKYEAAKAKKAEEASQAELKEIQKKEDAQAARTKEPAPEQKPSKKFIIDKLHVSGIVVQWGVLPIRIPSLTLTDIGRSSNGATLKDVWDQILASVMKAAGAVGDQLKSLGNFTGEAASKATEATTKAVSDSTKAVSDTASKATEATTKAVSDSTSKATKAVSDSASKATKAVGEGATKALDSIKNLW